MPTLRPMPRRKPPAPSLVDAILFAPDRARTPGARPVVACGRDEDPAFLRELEALGRARVELSRRGVEHGGLVELDLSSYGLEGREPLGTERGLRERWRAARPIVLPEIVREELDEFADELRQAFELFERLPDAGALGGLLRARELPPGMSVQARRTSLRDPERDVEKVLVACDDGALPPVRDLWLKSGYLSDHEHDGSLRVRVSFGREVDDDGSDDERRHRLVAELADAVFPETRAATTNAALLAALELCCGEEVYMTQTIAYWNAPEGGAAFHHDAFAGDGRTQQVGVCYVQLAGRTAWLALSLDDLADRVSEFVEELARGPHRWLRDQLFGAPERFERVRGRLADRGVLLRELALPGCGELAPLVNRGPEFTAFLADAGHALVLEEGDALLLPNHGLSRTAMHSVFCASEHPTYALSLALRTTRPRTPSPEPPPERPADDRPDREEIRRRRRESPRRRRR